MSDTINFGIDLGTTNSVITKYNNGKVEIFKNPIGHKETLPSVVAFRNERVIVGDKAREFLEKDPGNVIGGFKRKMGSDEKFYIVNLDKKLSPIELSSMVLKELKNFIHTGETLQHAIITIPASFDTVQSNATQQAGEMAGIIGTSILQEPIAASLAFLNDNESPTEGYRLVYDLGGGTFDVALVKTEDGEMDVLDHEGDNFLGGLDFDYKIIEDIICPFLKTKGNFENIEQELRSASGKYNKKYFELMKKAEDTKVALSSYTEAEIEFEIEDNDGKFIDAYFTISREEFEKSIEPLVTTSLEFITKLIERNNLTKETIEEILLIGGSTYIPYVRKRLADELQIKVNSDADPTTAVAVGAAYYAGTKKVTIAPTKKEETVVESNFKDLDVKLAYQKTSKQKEEYFAARFSGTYDNLQYRIIRKDGGFDSGLKPVTQIVEEDLPLLENVINTFEINLFEENGDKINISISDIEIAQGAYGITGQPLPEDICIEIDDLEDGGTKLEVIFERNSVLPLKKVLTKEITSTIPRGSQDGIFINILEGHQNASASTNKPIGTIEITGQDIERDLVKGSDVEIIIEINESRELKVSTYLMLSDQDFVNIFKSSERSVNIKKLNDEIFALLNIIRDQINDFEEDSRYEEANQLKKIEDDVMKLYHQVTDLPEDDVTDARYQLEDKKRKLSQFVDEIVKDQKIIKVKMDYMEWKKYAKEVVEQYGEENDKKTFDSLLEGEKSMLATNNKVRIKSLTEKFRSLYYKVRWRDPEFVRNLFYNFQVFSMEELPDHQRSQAQDLIAKGKQLQDDSQSSQLRAIVNQLYSLLPDRKREDMIKGTGIS